jgi:hypothetical protein
MSKGGFDPPNFAEMYVLLTGLLDGFVNSPCGSPPLWGKALLGDVVLKFRIFPPLGGNDSPLRMR